MNDFDAQCMNLALAEAEQSLAAGNYPVGAILAFDGKIVGTGNNLGETSKNYINHAETRLIIDNGEALFQAAAAGSTVTLYSTLEPCLMCLGVATMNKVNRIIYAQSDPHAGACSIDVKSLGVRYQEVWPEIIHLEHSEKSKELIVTFLHNQINSGVRVEWSQKFLKLLGET